MFSLPMVAIERRIRALKNRLGNLSREDAEARFSEEMEAQWSALMSKAENYVQGPDVLSRGGHFSADSVGNWFVIADEAGVERVPAEVISVVSPVMIMDAFMNLLNADSEEQRNAFFERSGEDFSRFVNDLQVIREDQMLRFDAGADGRLKAQIAAGRASGDVPDFKGYVRSSVGVLPDFDERIVSRLMENPENASPVWARDWVSPRMFNGDRDRAEVYLVNAQDAQRAADPMTPDSEAGNVGVRVEKQNFGDRESDGDLFPAEWRVFVRDGEVKAVGNYYTQISRASTPSDEDDASCAVADVVESAERVIDVLRSRGAIPHHPQYEDPTRRGFSPDSGHFTLDFMEVPDASSEFGRKLILVDAGVGHLRNPPFGAHPVSFGGKAEPEGVAFGLGDVRRLDDVIERARQVRGTSPSP